MANKVSRKFLALLVWAPVVVFGLLWLIEVISRNG